MDRRTRPEGPQEQRPQDQIKQYPKSGWEHGAQAHTAEKQTSSERAGAALEQQTSQARLCTPVGDLQSSTSGQSKIITKHTNTQACTSLTEHTFFAKISSYRKKWDYSEHKTPF